MDSRVKDHEHRSAGAGSGSSSSSGSGSGAGAGGGSSSGPAGAGSRADKGIDPAPEGCWRPGAVLFDMDGTLIDTEAVWFAAGSRLLEGLVPVLPDDAAEQLHGLDLDAVVRWLGDQGAPVDRDEYLGHLLEAVEPLLPEAPARDGAAEWVTAVAELGFPRAIVSNSPRSVIDTTLSSHEWARQLEIRVSVDDVGRGKPAPDLYVFAAGRLGVSPVDCLVLEDSRVGARAAVEAGATCVLVTFGSIDECEARRITRLVASDLPAAWRLAGLDGSPLPRR
jgi:HAD superfamily hydrolase (TIGR01509 family)